MRHSSYLLIREDLESSSYALMSDAEPTRLLSSMTLPRGAEADAVASMLQSVAGLEQGGVFSTSLRGDAGSLGRAAGRLAEAFGHPMMIVDIGHDAGRAAWSTPGASGELATFAEAALIPADASERRRRCDAVLRSIGERDRAAVADRLGDIADRPMSGRDAEGDLIRAAACVDAIRSMAERLDEHELATFGAVIIVTGQLSSYLALGSVPLIALSPLVPLGRTTILLDRAGVVAALGTEQLDDVLGAELAGATAEQLLCPAGDLLVVAERSNDVVAVLVGGEEYTLQVDGALEFDVAGEESAVLDVVSEDHQLSATLQGGLAGICVVRGNPQIDVASAPIAARPARALPYVAPLALLPRSASATGGLGGRTLLGDEVEGSLYFSATEPDSRAWAAAHQAGILAVVSASPETVLRARAVGIRGVVVGSLSDGEREALSASIDRRVAAGVAPAPFGLLILGGRRESDAWSAQLGTALAALHGSDVRLERHPAGITTSATRGAVERLGVDTVVIGGPRAGSYGTWRGLADVQSSDPQGAVEIDGELVVLPIGDLQRLVA